MQHLQRVLGKAALKGGACTQAERVMSRGQQSAGSHQF
jgi:hypothetical protein